MAEYTVTYNGLTMGPNTDYPVVSLNGLWDRDVLLNMPDLPRYHGAIVGASYHKKRMVELTVEVSGDPDTDFTPNRRALMAAFQPQVDTELPLTFTLTGETAKRVNVRPQRGASPVSVETESGLSTFVFLLEAADPAIYENTESSAMIEVFAASAGLSYPVIYPKAYGAGGSGAGTVVSNDGDWETWPRLQINGPSSGTMTNPIIENVTTGKTLELNAEGGVSITTGQVLIVESHPGLRTVQFSTGQSRYGKLSDDSEFWPLEPGDNELRFRASGSTTDATCDIMFRSAWI